MNERGSEALTILGIDPGYAILGYGIIGYQASRHSLIAYGTVETEKEKPLPMRLKTIYDRLSEIIEEYKPHVCAIEELYFSSNQKTAIKVGEARGAAILACAQAGISIYEYTPLQIKQALTGYGRADKHQIQEMVRQILGLERAPRPDDAADAVAAAICHANSSVYLERVAGVMAANGR